MGRDDEGAAETLVSPSGPAVESADRSCRELAGLEAGVLISRYRLVKRLGAGAMGVVWSAQDPQLDRMVAIKVVHPSLARAPEAASRLMREARAMAKVSHRAVVTIHDAGELEEHLFIAMELVEGTNLGTMLRLRDETDLLDWQRWLAMLIDAGHGLIAAHKVGILHRDFKPDNVLVDLSGRVCVGDFGLATLGDDQLSARMSGRWTSAATSSEVELTTTGALIGTPAYMSPQQLRSEDIDARADQFAYCVAAWEALYGKRPFQVTTQGWDAIPELAEQIEHGKLPDPPPESRVPSGVRAVLVRGLASDPAQRWPDMHALVDALERAGRAPTEIRRRRSRAPWSWATGLAVIALGVAIAVVTQREPTRPNTLAATTPHMMAVDKPVLPLAKKWFDVPMRTSLAISSDGKYLAISNDRITVYDLETNRQWLLLIAANDEVSHMEVTDNVVRFGVGKAPGIKAWVFRTETTAKLERQLPPARWFGTLSAGELVYDNNAGRLDLLGPDDKVLRTWNVGAVLDDITISPDRRRFSFIEDGRFTGRLGVCDERLPTCVYSEPLVSPTAAVFADNTSLLAAIGTTTDTTIVRSPITTTNIGKGELLYAVDAGWFGPLRVANNKLVFVQMQPTPRARVLTRSDTKTSVRDLDSSVSLAWTSPTEFLAWNVLTKKVEKRTPATPLALTEMAFATEPVNATISGDALIVARRSPSGRQIEARSRTDGHLLWRHQDGLSLAVRCAGDLKPPCYAIRVSEKTNERLDTIVTLDPATGELGTQVLASGKIEDLAVSPKADKLAYVGDGGSLRILDLASGKVTHTDLVFPSLRSIAFDPKGGYLLAGTRVRNNYIVARWHTATLTTLSSSFDDLTMLVRPSPETGNDILVLSRSYQPELWLVEYPGGIPGPRGAPVP